MSVRKFERLGINAERMREEEDMMGTQGAVDELEPLEHEVETPLSFEFCGALSNIIHRRWKKTASARRVNTRDKFLAKPKI